MEQETSDGRDIILEIDVQGADAIRAKVADRVEIFILPPSYEVLQERLIGRQTENQIDLQMRLGNSRDEVKEFEKFDYVIINDELEKAISDLQSIIYAERCRSRRQNEAVEKILETFEK